MQRFALDCHLLCTFSQLFHMPLFLCVCVCVSLITLIWLAFSALSAVWLTFLAYAGDRNAEQWQGETGLARGRWWGWALLALPAAVTDM